MPNFGLVDFLIKKGGHAYGYGLLALAFLYGLRGEKRKITPRQLLLAWALSSLYSATDEFHQFFVPGRHPAITDVMIDSIGAATAMFFAGRYFKQKDQHDGLVTDN